MLWVNGRCTCARYCIRAMAHRRSSAQPLPKALPPAQRRAASAPLPWPVPVRGSAQPPPEAPAMAWSAGRGAHPAPNEAEWIVAHTTYGGWETWFCNLCQKEVTIDNGHIDSTHHANKVHWLKWRRQREAPPPSAAAASSNASASSVVVEAPAALAPATTQGGTILLELPVAVAVALKDALERALAGRQQ